MASTGTGEEANPLEVVIIVEALDPLDVELNLAIARGALWHAANHGRDGVVRA